MTTTTKDTIRIVADAEDGEPRVGDAELAARLDYSDVSEFRKLIRRNEKFLRKINILVEAPIIHAGAGRPTKAYHLTKTQAVFIIGQSGTPRAKDISVEIAIAFVEYRRRSFDTRLYGAIARDLLLPAPRAWEREFGEAFWAHLHRVGNWKRPLGNNHSNCAHFINRFVYEYLLGKLGLTALRDANPKNDAGERAHRHHQMLKEKHLGRLRQHIAIVTSLLANAVTLGHFADLFARAFPDADAQLGFLFVDEAVPLPAAAEEGRYER